MAQLPGLADRDFYGIEIAFIYGSVAAGIDTVESDIDLFIIGTLKLSAVSPSIAALEEILNREINVSLYTAEELVKRRASDVPFVMAVLGGDKIFVIGDQNLLTEALG